MTSYWLDLFTPRTWEEARQRGFKVTGFRPQRWPHVSKIKAGDLFVCYITQLGRFSGITKATSNPYKDEVKAREIWTQDFFPCLIDVTPVVALDFLHSLPKSEVIPKLSVAAKFGGLIRGSPVRIPTEDGEIIQAMLEESEKHHSEYPLTEKVSIRPQSRTRPVKSTRQYGAPIEFRGLRHAPLNEQGVVYMFALVARELGFTVEAIGTAFPDCEAKRRIDKKGERWEPVRVEFEYLSSHFKVHRHSVEGCDIIVCWKNDWESCPVEVIELSTTIEKLGAKFLNMD